jgi:hypothetical protein
LAVAQLNSPTVVYSVGDGTLGPPQVQPGEPAEALAYPCCTPGLLALEDGVANWWTEDGTLLGRSGPEGKLAFGVSGAEVKRSVSGRPLRLAALDSHLLESAPRAVFGADGALQAVLDNRTLQARVDGSATFALSHDGRRFARHTCRHVEVWEAGILAGGLAGRGASRLAPSQVLLVPVHMAPAMLVMQASAPYGCPAGAVAFDPGGGLVAAVREGLVDLWRVEDGRLLGTLAAADRAVAVAIDGDARITVVSVQADGVVVRRWMSPKG